MKPNNTEVLQEMRDIIKEGRTVDVDIRDRLLFTSVIGIIDRLDRLEPMFAFYRGGMFFVSAIGLGILSFIGALLTGKVEIVSH